MERNLRAMQECDSAGVELWPRGEDISEGAPAVIGATYRPPGGLAQSDGGGGGFSFFAPARENDSRNLV